MLIALLVGLAAGKAWERYKLVEGRWIDRRRVRQSPHFILGLNYLVAGQVDLAIEELEQASRLDPGALEIRLVLGNLYREKGQVGRAIRNIRRCCSGRGSTASSTRTCCSVSDSTIAAAGSSTARSRRSRKC